MNFKHLHYFWVTAKAGGIMRAGEQLHTTPQTLSAQIKLLEDWLGRKLFRKSGRNLELTEDGHLALGYADQIFTLGAELEAAVRQARDGQRVLDFKVGVADSVTKSIAYRLLEPALSVAEPVRLVCSEGNFPDLLAQLALNRLDLVLADEPMSKRISVKAFNHPLGRTTMSFFCAPQLRPHDTIEQFGVELIGRTDELVDEFYAVTVERRITHPCVVAITDAARGRLFG